MTRPCFAALLLVSAGLLVRAADKPVADDPPPEGAKFRLGTARLRTPSGAVTTDSIALHALAPDGKFLVGRSLRQGTVFVDPATGQAVRAVARDPNASLAEIVAVSADGSRAVAVSINPPEMVVLDTRTGASVARVILKGPAGPDGVAISADGKRLVIGGERPAFGKDATKGALSAVVWDVDANKQLTSVAPPQTTKAFVALSPDGKRAATWGTGGTPRPGDGLGKRVPGWGAGDPIRPKGGVGKGSPEPPADPSKGVQIWDAETGKEVAKVSAGQAALTTAVFSPDGASIAVSGGTGSVHLIDIATKKEKRAFFGCSGQGQRLAFSPDGKTLAAVSDEEIVQRWSVAEARLLDTTEPPVPPGPRTVLALLRAGKPDVRGFVYTDNGRVLVWGVRGDLNLVWEAPAGRAVSPTDGHRAPVGGVAADKEFLTAADDGVLIRWDTATGKPLDTLALKVVAEKGFPGERVNSFRVALAPNGSWAITCGATTAPQVFALPSGRQHFVIPGSHEKRELAFSRDGGTVVVVASGREKTGAASKVSAFELAGARRVGEFTLPADETADTASVSPNGARVCTFGARHIADQDDEYAVTGWELATGKKLAAVAVPVERPLSSRNVFVAALTDTTALVVTPRSAFVADYAAGKKVHDLDLGERTAAPLTAPAVSPDGKTVALCTNDFAAGERAPAVILFDAETGKVKKTFTGPTGTAWGVAFSKDGKYLLVGSRDTTALVYDLSAP